MTSPFDPMWHGSWIWVEDPTVTQGSPIAPDRRERPPSYALFRKSFELATLPSTMRARISADSRYKLYINGGLIGRGPVRSQPRRLRQDTYDIAPHLRSGQNTIAIEVLYYGRANSTWMPAVGNGTLGRSGMAVFEACYDALGEQHWITSDDTWSALHGAGQRDDAYDPNASVVASGVPAQSFDARAYPANWQAPSFNDADWLKAKVIMPLHMGGPGRAQPPADPYGTLRGHDLPPMTEVSIAPVSMKTQTVFGKIDVERAPPAARVEASILSGEVIASENNTTFPLQAACDASQHSRVILDFGRIVAGFVDLSITADPGQLIDLSFDEAPITMPAHFGAHGGIRYIARGHEDQIQSFDRQGLRYITVISDGPFQITDCEVQESLYPWQPGPKFQSSDPELEQLYEAGKRTVALNSWDCFIDCPTREQRAWTGDSIVHLMTHLVANGDWELCWHNLELVASPRSDGILPLSVASEGEYGEGFTIPDWSLHWLHGVYLMYLYHGNKKRLRPLLSVAENMLRWFTGSLSRDGLLRDVPEWCLLDWSATYARGLSAPVNASWARGLREFAEMAAWMGDQGRADWASGLWSDLRDSFDIFWDEDRGIYVDHVIGAERQSAANQIATSMAVAAGLVPQDRQTRAMTTATQNLVERSWLFGPVDPKNPGARFGSVLTSNFTPDWDVETQVVSAMPFMSYVVHDAAAQAGLGILPNLKRWTRFLSDGYESFRETWMGGSYAHGWSATPTRDMVVNVIGLRPVEPGFARAKLEPQIGDLQSISATQPTPKGLIHVSIDHGKLALETPVPVDVTLSDGTVQSLEPGTHQLTL